MDSETPHARTIAGSSTISMSQGDPITAMTTASFKSDPYIWPAFAQVTQAQSQPQPLDLSSLAGLPPRDIHIPLSATTSAAPSGPSSPFRQYTALPDQRSVSAIRPSSSSSSIHDPSTSASYVPRSRSFDFNWRQPAGYPNAPPALTVPTLEVPHADQTYGNYSSRGQLSRKRPWSPNLDVTQEDRLEVLWNSYGVGGSGHLGFSSLGDVSGSTGEPSIEGVTAQMGGTNVVGNVEDWTQYGGSYEIQAGSQVPAAPFFFGHSAQPTATAPAGPQVVYPPFDFQVSLNGTRYMQQDRVDDAMDLGAVVDSRRGSVASGWDIGEEVNTSTSSATLQDSLHPLSSNRSLEIPQSRSSPPSDNMLQGSHLDSSHTGGAEDDDDDIHPDEPEANDPFHDHESHEEGDETAVDVKDEHDGQISPTAANASKTGPGKAQANNFVNKLHLMISDPKSADFIWWTELGTSFIVSSAGEFSRSILGQHFKHSNVSFPSSSPTLSQ